MRVSIRSIGRGVAAATLAAATVSCGDVARTGRAPAMVVIEMLEASSGADPGTFGGFLLSDVQTLVEQTINGETILVPTIFNDVAQATVRLVLKDQGGSASEVAPSALNAVTLHRYRINFVRTDGRNTPGVDVPYPVDGAVTATISGGATVVVPFEMVRHQAKVEQPLRSLVQFGGRQFIATIAEVTFFGSDLAGNDVQATGTISVNFGDFADPE